MMSGSLRERLAHLQCQIGSPTLMFSQTTGDCFINEVFFWFPGLHVHDERKGLPRRPYRCGGKQEM